MPFRSSWTDMILCVRGPQSLLAEQIGRRPSACPGVPGFTAEQIMPPLNPPSCPPHNSPEPPDHPPPSARDPNEDLLCIARTFCYLRESGWYWGSITATEAKQKLQKMPEGSFLVRDSTHPSYLFTLSVRTNRGPTNVRIEYADSLFRLDSNWLSKPRVLSFPDIVSLVQHYVLSCSSDSAKEPAGHSPPAPAGHSPPAPAGHSPPAPAGHSPPAPAGHSPPAPAGHSPPAPAGHSPPAPAAVKEPAPVHLKLLQPLHCSGECPSLQHLCRLRIHQSLAAPEGVTELPLPRRVVGYLQSYPFTL